MNMIVSFVRQSGVATAVLAVAIAALSSCAKTNSTEQASRAIDAYCPYLPSKAFATPVSISGTAFYEYRVNGNGAASDSAVVVSVDVFATPATRSYSITVNGRAYTVTSDLAQTSAQQDVITKLKAAMNGDTTAGLYVYGVAQLNISQPALNGAPSVTAPNRLTIGTTNPAARPIRFMEIAVKNSSGEIVQCAETAADGTFAFDLSQNTGNYTVELRSRAANSRSNVYVLDNPTNNTQHSISTMVSSAATNSSLFLRARVHEGLLSGAFNILDQILNAQDYLRAQTLGCATLGQPNYFPGCVPFDSAPLVKVYWSPGVSPSIYVGTTGAISFYLNTRRELYVQGGQSGNVTSSDMDHFDNSVIVHEYAHFLEDVYGKSDSPGGSHNGDAIIDPRLAWGEGWANFFQAAVSGDATYRDTYGTPDCTSACAGTYYNASIDPAGTPANDAPTMGALGEGNFREFSITRMLWDVIKPAGGVSRFAEIWRLIVSSGVGMHDVNDPFKSVGRVHAIQTAYAGANTWSSLRLNEEQIPGFSVYATPFLLATSNCASSPISMTPVRSPGDYGSFATSDQYRNNDFLRFDHAGGRATIELYYSKSSVNPPDLDIYVYKSKYVFGRASDMLISSAFNGDGCPASGAQFDTTNPFRGQSTCPAPPSGISSTYGYEKGSANLDAGTYMINVQADTTTAAGTATSYVLFLNGQIVCPTP